MQNRIDDCNYMNDPRTQPPANVPTITKDIPCPSCEGEYVVGSDDDGNAIHCADCEDGTHYFVEVELPYKWDVCPVCEGRGSHVNPSIDAGGLSLESLHDDPDFSEDYRRGMYDQTCNRCAGKRVVPVVDENRCTPEDLKEYYEEADADADYRAEALAERRMGA